MTTEGHEAVFEVGAQFEAGEVSGNLQVGKFEAYYEELFAEVIEDGIITAEERSRLDRAAESLGLDRARLRKLELALQAAYEARHQVRIRDLTAPIEDEDAPRASLQPLEPATDQRTLALERRVKFLEARIADLERELEEAKTQVAVEVDLSDFAATPQRAVPEDDPLELQRRVRHDPRDVEAIRSLFRLFGRKGDIDRRWCMSHALVYLDAATDEERKFFAQYHDPLIKPKSSLQREGWNRLLFHPEQEVLVGEILAVVVSAVLLGRVSALRRDKALPKLDPTRKQNPAESTLQAVRCFSWAAALLGMQSPALYADPHYAGTVEMVPGIPPASRFGKQALSGRSAPELAFLAGHHLSGYREETFTRQLFSSIPDLEDIFLAALSIGNPGLPLAGQVKARVVPIAKAIEPILEPAAVDRLRGQFLRFVEEGGRTNLQRWANAVDKTASRAGLLLANDLRAAHTMIALEDPSHLEERMDDLLEFTTSERYGRLRRQLGVHIESN
ncbi:MAG TPA: hypothetical protein PLI95_22410 [Polyangiaceae bacterium]|nr:hypothetical protein [Polyangiaceae bacterium]